MSVNDIFKYKRAKVLVKDLTELEIILNETYNKLIKYKNYVPARSLLNVIKDNKIIIDVHLKEQTRIVNNKGATSEST